MQKQLRNIAAIYITAVTHTRTIVVACVLHMHLATPISLKSSQKREMKKNSMLMQRSSSICQARGEGAAQQ